MMVNFLSFPFLVPNAIFLAPQLSLFGLVPQTLNEVHYYLAYWTNHTSCNVIQREKEVSKTCNNPITMLENHYKQSHFIICELHMETLMRVSCK